MTSYACCLRTSPSLTTLIENKDDQQDEIDYDRLPTMPTSRYDPSLMQCYSPIWSMLV